MRWACTELLHAAVVHLPQSQGVVWASGPLCCRAPEFGDVVEYPLRAIECQELQDGRVAGVGLVVGRNMDRGDAGKLPEDQLDLCEIEPLRQEEAGSSRWVVMNPIRYPSIHPSIHGDPRM